MWKRIEKGIYQEGKYSFRVRMMIAGNKLDKTFDTLNEARTYRDLHKASAALDVHEAAVIESREKKRAAKGFTVMDAIQQYRHEKTEKKKGWESESTRLDKLSRCSFVKRSLYTIHRSDILEMFEELKTMGTAAKGVKPRPLSPSSLKRYYNLTRHIFQVAVDEWKRIDKNPFEELKKSDISKDSEPRDRRLEGNEYEQLLEHLKGEARAILILCVETAMRRGNVLGLEWRYIKFKEHTAYLPDTKSGKSQIVPLSTRAEETLKRLPRSISGKVFSIGKDALKYQWKKARAAIGSPDLRLHDLRHEATSRLFEKGLGIMQAQVVTGHKTLRMLKRYTHLNPTEIAKKLG